MGNSLSPVCARANQVCGPVNPTTWWSGSVAAVTRASAVEASRAESGIPEMGAVIEPETSNASR